MPDTGAPEIHAGKDETSAMLVLAPHLVRQDLIAKGKASPDGEAIRTLILDPGASFPWSSDDPRLAAAGVIGDARQASVEHGQAIVARVIEAAGAALKQMVENQQGAR